MTVAFVCFAEDSLHWATIHAATDHYLRALVGWLNDHDDLSPHRSWVVDDEARSQGRGYLNLHRGARGFADGRTRVHGHFDGQPGAPDAKLTRECILTAQALEPRPHAIFLARDTDGESRRLVGIEQAVGEFSEQVVVALAHPEMEAWAIATCTAATDVLRAELQLSFDPRQLPSKLSSKSASKKDAKRIAERLGATEVDVKRLEQVPDAEAVGIARFISDLRRTIQALFRLRSDWA